jgi:hypothetical protein
MSRRRAIGAPLAALALAGCGGSGHPTIRNVGATSTSAGAGVKRFSASGMALHFDYPASFRVIQLGPTKRVAGTNHHATHAAVGLGTYDLLTVSRFPGLPIPVTQANIATLKASFDRLISQAFGRPMTGRVGTAGGRPAIFWPRAPTPGLPVTASTETANVFLGHDEYEIECQATPPRLAAIQAACRQLFATLSFTP